MMCSIVYSHLMMCSMVSYLDVGQMMLYSLSNNFKRVPRKVLWLATRVVCVPEWIVAIVQVMSNG